MGSDTADEDDKEIEYLPAKQNSETEETAERLYNFAERYMLNSRETKIMEKMVSGDDTVKKIAESLGISERTCERNITSIYEKTATKSRAALLILFLGSDSETTH